ncbi:MAG: hypothetical protein AAGC65_25785 [Mucilaginibacter sp.]|uniref:hypothetical protein n=1 Tax=Mucilaginibacter sp. TaxID=1882438 RepID=UPI0031B123A0
MAVLTCIFVQDMRSRAVYWLLFPVLILLFIAERSLQLSFTALLGPTLINISFLSAQLFLLWFWFSFRRKQSVDLTGQLLGLGDILFLVSIAFCFSILNFIIFYVISLLLIAIGWLLWQTFLKEENKFLPLAGLQAFLLMLCLIADWLSSVINLTDDQWVLNLIM